MTIQYFFQWFSTVFNPISSGLQGRPDEKFLIKNNEYLNANSLILYYQKIGSYSCLGTSTDFSSLFITFPNLS